jgi:hypothetical protein
MGTQFNADDERAQQNKNLRFFPARSDPKQWAWQLASRRIIITLI